MKFLMRGMVAACHLITLFSYSQDKPDTLAPSPVLQRHFLQNIDRRASGIDRSLVRSTDKYLERTARQERRMARRLYKIDSVAAKELFPASSRYNEWMQKMRMDSGGKAVFPGGIYQPYADSLQGMLKYLKGRLPAEKWTQSLDGASAQYNALAAKLANADQIRDYVKQRSHQITAYLGQHAETARLLGRQFQGMKEGLYYYSQSLREYKASFNDPDKLEMEMLSVLNKIPAFQAFMKQNGQLAGLFGLPANYGSPEGITGLQTKDQVAALIQQQIGGTGPGGQELLQSRLESAQGEMSSYKDKLDRLGEGGSDIDMPDFKPNGQKTKTFWRRLEYGTNFQTTRNNSFYPNISDLGLSVGYKIDNSNTVGVGASYKLGWGRDIQHISFSSQGVGLRSFIDCKVKGSFFASGGFEYNYTTPFTSAQQLRKWDDWSKSGLIGVSKIVSLKSRAFKKSKLQLLWDFLSYQQIPRTQPILFRINYTF